MYSVTNFKQFSINMLRADSKNQPNLRVANHQCHKMIIIELVYVVNLLLYKVINHMDFKVKQKQNGILFYGTQHVFISCLFVYLHLANISFRLFKRLRCYDFRICIIKSSPPWTIGCTKIWRFHQKITEPSQKLCLTIRRKHANF